MSFSQRIEEIRTGFEPAFWVANFTEIFERVAYYGTTAVLAIYLNEQLHFSRELTGWLVGTFGLVVWFLPILGGTLADKFGPRTLMLFADVMRCALVGVLTFLAARHTASLVTLGPTAALIGAGEGLFLPGSFAIVPALLPDEDLQSGNALASGGTQLATLAGPAIGGVLVALLGPSPAFALDAVSFVVSALMLARLRAAQRPAG